LIAEIAVMIIPTISISVATFFWGQSNGEKKALDRILDKQMHLNAMEHVKQIQKEEEKEEEQYNKSYGNPEVIDYFDQEYAKKGVKQ
jgi:hypothetical protein